MSKKVKLVMSLLLVVVAISAIAVFYYDSSELAGTSRQSSAEYARIENISKSFELPSDLTLVEKTKIYDSLSSADGAGWQYRYTSTQASHDSCLAIQKVAQANGYEVAADNCTTHEKTSIEELSAKNNEQNIRIYARTEGNTPSTFVKIEWNNLD